MSAIHIHADQSADLLGSSTDFNEIQQILSGIGVRFERWEADREIVPGMASEEILEAYRKEVERLKNEEGYVTVDVISLQPDHPEREALRQKFLSEHTHSEDEVRFFVDGEGMFYLHVEDKVYQVHCCKNDLISVPANTTHWFDMGPAPRFTALRLFNNPEGWVANFTGSDIADRHPRFEPTTT
jgi:1,2-dihydroxy-3-keto-5-methylthiopentene dioxygenase